MHLRRPPVASSLLLLPCLMLLTTVPALPDPPAGRVPHLQLKLPANKVTYQLLHRDGPCKCRQVCFAITCFCYTLVKTDADTLDCYFSKDDVRKTDMIAATNSTTVCHSDYLPFGVRFYRIYPAMNLWDGSNRCKADNGWIPIIDTEEKKQELVDAMKRADYSAVVAGIDPPSNAVWGNQGYGWFSFALTLTGSAIRNQRLETAPLPIACQRDY